MIVAEAPLTRRYFITNAVHTVSSFSYNRPVQLKHAHNHDLTRVLIQAMNINSLSNTYTLQKVVTNKPSPLNTQLFLATRGHSLAKLGVKRGLTLALSKLMYDVVGKQPTTPYDDFKLAIFDRMEELELEFIKRLRKELMNGVAKGPQSKKMNQSRIFLLRAAMVFRSQ
ncbi:hypothetical protein ACTXT7_014643 [Hymenolepis weldensis]